MRLAVIVATYGRREEVEDLLGDLATQTRRPDRIIVSVTDDRDVPAGPGGLAFEVVRSARRGLCAQRNAGLDLVRGRSDVVVFLDDDFVPHRAYLERLEATLRRDAGISGVTGLVVADGVRGPGLAREEALEAIDRHVREFPDGDPTERPRWSLYGCNMAIRMPALGDRRFDEKLPLYGWLEDMDLSVQLKAHGRLIRAHRLVGAHRGVKKGRTRGVPLGYSQVANPIYLWQKGTVPASLVCENILTNCTANLVRSLFPEPYVDRRGRLRGNLLALADAVLRRSTPARILDM